MARMFITIEPCKPGLPVRGCACGSMTTDTILACDDGVLTPGDECPAGRCPECEVLVYLDRPEDRARDAAGEMLEALRKAETILAADRARRARADLDDTVGCSVLALVSATIAKAEGR